MAALAFVHGGPLSKGNEQRDEQRERKPEREKKGNGNGVAVLFLSLVVVAGSRSSSCWRKEAREGIGSRMRTRREMLRDLVGRR